ncbi:MAG TPA: penicillin-binding protein [Cryomorphaceae bacterium]|nr:penicillin-binding protein [Cryomorphaceae bacterium]
MSTELKHIKSKITWISAVIYLFFVAIAGRLFYVSLIMGPELREISQERLIERREIPAKRGDIYSSDGKALATTKPVYTVHFDPITVDENIFQNEVGALAAQLAELNPARNASEWENYLRTKRNQKNRYVLLSKDLNYSDLQRMRQYPILERGMYKGGIIVHMDQRRIQMATDITLRTIGYDTEAASAGLEGYYSAYLKGKPGNRLMQKIVGDDWKPLDDPQAVEPVDGFDLVTTIDTRIQDVAQRSLLNQLAKYEADHGCVVVMEAETGRIVAMANLGRNPKDSIYSELRNYAVWERTEPGSTMKLLSTMALLETGTADTNTLVDTENGIYTVYGKKVRDSRKGGYGKINLRRAFELSSNTGIVKLVEGSFKEKPGNFVDFLYRRKFDQTTGVQIKGETAPIIPKPSDDNWSGLSLPWMSYGYGVEFTPLQLLTIYNAVANDGDMIKPQVVEKIMDHGREVESFEPEIIKRGICSAQTIDKLQILLEGAVRRGTATNIYDEKVTIAGKTGTCQLNYWRGGKDYQSSFVGYFPADNPRYSCIVVISKPNYFKGYYGNIVAGPVFKAIADEVYHQLPHTPQVVGRTQLALAAQQAHDLNKQHEALEKNYLPNLRSLDLREALEILESAGLEVKVQGHGKVVKQEPALGTSLHQCSTVTLWLQ